MDHSAIQQVYFRQFLPVSPKVSSADILNWIYLPKWYIAFTQLNKTTVFPFHRCSLILW